MPDFLIDLLKRNRSPEPKQPLDALQDSASEMTLIDKSKAVSRKEQKQNNKHPFQSG
ncbi:hypothetical protein AARAC_010396 [Aspergillus arachidicola]|uniref:Uncharacterized protein n=1 Tax=Aspergillus arachidicola TaxID=656916 RepID=A0A2G7G8R2_9EURO|nr:hypothetical protein AARAC_010396 [Aspergillus arachidicola]